MSDEISQSEDSVDPRESAAPEALDDKSEPSRDGKGGAQRHLDLPREYGGRKGPEPVRYGDWEKNGRCIDF